MKYKLHFNIRLFEDNALMNDASINRLKAAIKHIVRTAKKKYDDGSWLYLSQIKSDFDLSDGGNASLYSRDIRMVLSSLDAGFKKDESVEETIKRVKADIKKGEYENEIDVRFVFTPPPKRIVYGIMMVILIFIISLIILIWGMYMIFSVHCHPSWMNQAIII